jgi:hypothetical protein
MTDKPAGRLAAAAALVACVFMMSAPDLARIAARVSSPRTAAVAITSGRDSPAAVAVRQHQKE